ncbi:AAA family ATPase, partial [bacterium]|nr:AAA family ATPase [bacterium]
MISRHFVQSKIEETEVDLNFESTQLIVDLIEDSDSVSIDSLIFFLIYLFQALQDGSVCLVLSNDQANHNLEQKQKWVQPFLDHLPDYAEVISKGYSRSHPIIYEDLHKNTKRFFFHRYFLDRNKTRDLLIELSQKNHHTSIDPSSIISHLYQEDFALRIEKKGVLLAQDSWQLQAIEKSLLSDFLIISGGPGTGKTSLMVNILRALTTQNLLDIQLIAPTGRASQRMTEALRYNISTISKPSEKDLYLFNEIEGKTIHRLLKMRSNGAFYYNKDRKLKSDIIVVDEVSMIDADLMSALLSSLDLSKTKLIFMGDKNQLPSVQAGAVFSDLLSMKDLASSQIELKTTYRSKVVLQEFSKNVNSDDYQWKDKFLDQIPNLEEDQYYFLNDQKITQREDTLKSWLELSYLSDHWCQLLKEEANELVLQKA